MRFMVIVKANADSESGRLPKDEEFASMREFNERLGKSANILAADGLQPSSKGARLRFDGGRVTVTDGPFAETKELVAGFWIVEMKSKEEAIEWFSRAPFGPGAVLEVRPLYEESDFEGNA